MVTSSLGSARVAYFRDGSVELARVRGHVVEVLPTVLYRFAKRFCVGA